MTDQDSTTDFSNLNFSAPRLAILDLSTAARSGRCPAWTGSTPRRTGSRTGSHILYISDRTGIPNLFIRDLETGRDARITNVMNGVNGIIPLSPAATLSRDGHRVVFSSFSKGAWDLFAIKDPLTVARYDAIPAVARVAPAKTPAETPAATAAVAPDTTVSASRPRLLLPAAIESLAALPSTGDLTILRHAKKESEAKPAPPLIDTDAPMKVGEVFRMNRDLPDTTGFVFDRYHVRFTVDYASAAGFYASNVGVAAQTLLSFSDVLGNNNLIIGADVYGTLSDSNLLFQYVNRARRNNYGFALFQYRDDFLLSTAETSDEYVSQIYRGVELDLARPFSRFRRLEFSLAGLSVDEQVFRQAYYGDGIYDLTRTDRKKLYFVRPGPRTGFRQCAVGRHRPDQRREEQLQRRPGARRSRELPLGGRPPELPQHPPEIRAGFPRNRGHEPRPRPADLPDRRTLHAAWGGLRPACRQQRRARKHRVPLPVDRDPRARLAAAVRLPRDPGEPLLRRRLRLEVES